MRKSSIILYIIIVILGTMGGAWSVWSHNYVLLPVFVIVVFFSANKIISLYSKSIRKVDFLLNSIDNDDYTFKFSEDDEKSKDYFLNYALNRIKEIISTAKLRAVEKEKYYELIMDSIKTGIVTINESGNVYQSNKEGLKVIGLDVFTHVNQLSTISTELRDALVNIRSGEKRNVVVNDERGEKNISMTASEIKVNNAPLRIVVLSDINSELAEKELESWARLIRVLTHEIMNSLAPITSLSNTLIDICDDKESDMAKGLATINATGKGLISFVDSYRKFTHIPTPNKKAFAVKPWLERIIALQSDVTTKIKLSVDPVDILVYADESLITQVIVNVLNNALYATEAIENSLIEICAYIDDNENDVIEISNNGGAIPKDVADNIFMPFFTTKKTGSGIGLSLSRQIMRQHKGSIGLSSNTDQRVTFTMIFV
ncbi:MAG: ATP-binding protein [Bacteroidales bacterium]|nr:ATP-binding protein [Bacteroidales bacterium]